ncbi:Fibroin-3 related protein [Apiospora rasikravindrae]|uniref:Fibroin-3 related protein n=1 Tax=Apiospora rasikravindrae TaxID=990691 RepID=A0ABR1UDM5_9PEZI
MPHIGSVMERSLVPEQSVGEALMSLAARSVAAGFMKRDIIGDAKGQAMDVQKAFSSWDNCMQAVYCKWPVIGVIILGGLIIFSIIWCCVRCLCCGLSCCCSCFRCLKCCGNCCGCCDSPQQKNKYLDEPFVPPHHAENQAYRSQAPMYAPTMAPTMVPAAAPSYAKSEPPQYAEFDSGKKGGGDELPQMPSWEGASSKQVLIEEDAVELEPMKKPEPMQNVSPMAAGGMTPGGVSPANRNSPYGPPSQVGSNGYMGAAQSQNNMYGMNGNGSGQVYNDGYNNGSYGQGPRDNMNQGYDNQPYGDQSGGQGYDQGYDQGYGMPAGAAAAAGAMGQGRRTPAQDYNSTGGYGAGQVNQGYPQSQTPRPYDDYSRSITPSNAAYGNAPPARHPTPQGNGPYGSPNRMRTPAPQQQGDGYNNPRGYNQGGYGAPDPRMRASPAPLQPQHTGYSQSSGYGGFGERSQTPKSYARQQPGAGPRRQNTYDVTPQTARAPPQRSYTDVPPPASPIQNTGGFDFTSGYSRAEESASPPQAANGGTAYPGYRAYKPAV